MEKQHMLKLIQSTNLLFEIKEDLWGKNGLNHPSSASGNSLWKNKRPEKSLVKDYEYLERIAVEKSYGIIGIGGEMSYNLEMILEEYYQVSCSLMFRSKGKIHLKGDYVGRSKNELRFVLLDMFSDFYNGRKQKQSLFESLRLDIKNRDSIITNYYTSIGVLLLLDIIPPCLDDTRFRGDLKRLSDDTKVAFDFISSMINDSKQQNASWQLRQWKSRAESHDWCRLSLIVAFTELISILSVEKIPSLLDIYNQPLNIRLFIVPEDYLGFYVDKEKQIGTSDFYLLENNPSRNKEYYLYHYSNKGGWRAERFDLNFFHNGSVHINTIDYFYNFIDGNGKYRELEQKGRFSVTNGLKIDWETKNLQNNLSLQKVVERKEVQELAEISKRANLNIKNHEHSLESIVLESSLAMITNTHILLDGRTRFLISPNTENQIDLDNLTIKDEIAIFSIGEKKVLFIGKLWKAEDITSPMHQEIYGVKLLSEKKS